MSRMNVYSDGENLFIARDAKTARDMFIVVYGGDTPADHGRRLHKLRPRQLVTFYADDDENPDGVIRTRASTVARSYPGQTILAR